MTALGSASAFTVPSSSMPDAAIDTRPVVFPGRWVGGAIGALATVLVGAGLFLFSRLAGDLDLGMWIAICALGIPIAFVLGRLLGPTARDGGWGSAFIAAISFGFLAPILGDIEIVGGNLLVPSITNQGGADAVAGALFVGLVGLVFCFVAAPVTLAVGMVWVILMRTLPVGDTTALRVPRWLERLGVRHAVIALGTWTALAQVVWAMLGPER